MDARAADVEKFWSGGGFDPDSNVQFGEGGAGTFSDGKLNSGIKDPRCREVLETFHRMGAPEEILYLSLIHIFIPVSPSTPKVMDTAAVTLPSASARSSDFRSKAPLSL